MDDSSIMTNGITDQNGILTLQVAESTKRIMATTPWSSIGIMPLEELPAMLDFQFWPFEVLLRKPNDIKFSCYFDIRTLARIRAYSMKNFSNLQSISRSAKSVVQRSGRIGRSIQRSALRFSNI